MWRKGWVSLTSAVGLLLSGTPANAAGDGEVLSEFRKHLTTHCTGVSLDHEDDEAFTLRHVQIGEVVISKAKLKRYVAEAEEAKKPRTVVYDQYCRQIQQAAENSTFSKGKDAKRIRPRLVRSEWVAGLPKDHNLPKRPLGDTGLWVVYVLDSQESVAFVSDVQQAQLKMSEPELFAQAIANLDKKPVQDALTKATTTKTMVVLKTGDSFDAARLLLIPTLLKPGQEVAAVVSDRDTLLLIQTPPQGEWEKLRDLAEANDGDPLLRVPLLVTTSGFFRKGVEHSVQ